MAAFRPRARSSASGPRTSNSARPGTKPADAITLPLTVAAVERVGPESFVYGTLDRGDNIIVRLPGTHAPAPGERAVAVRHTGQNCMFSAPTGSGGFRQAY